MSDFKITCLVVDDEPMAAALVEGYVNKTPFLTLKATFHTAIDALQYINENPVDLIFLDIQMPDLTGMELSKMLPKATKVVFTTAFDQYALESYKIDALDYLLKPFNYAEFLHASNKALEWFRLVNLHHLREAKPYIFVKSEYKLLKVRLSDIVYVEGLKDYIKIWLIGNSKPILTLKSLKTMEVELPEDNFLRIHKSYIIALDKIDAIERSQVLIGEKRITVSEQYKEVFNASVS